MHYFFRNDNLSEQNISGPMPYRNKTLLNLWTFIDNYVRNKRPFEINLIWAITVRNKNHWEKDIWNIVLSLLTRFFDIIFLYPT
jgi:hypothetical protein